MINNIIYYGVMLLLTIIAFILGKFVFPKVPVDKIKLIESWAIRFINWAKEFLCDKSGEEKMDAVIDQLRKICYENKIELSDEQLRAIAQTAYNTILKESYQLLHK